MFCQARAAALEELAARWDAKQIWCCQGWPDRLLGVFMVNSTGKMMIDFHVFFGVHYLQTWKVFTSMTSL